MNRLTRIAFSASTLALATTLFAANCAGHRASAATAVATEANITRLTTDMLEHSQFAHHALDKELAGKFLDSYFDALDGARALFLQSDLDEFAGWRANLARITRQDGDTSPARIIFKRYVERVEQRSAYVAEQLKTPAFDFTGHETFGIDREHAVRPRDVAAAQELWRQQLRAEYLQAVLDGTAAPQIAGKLTRRYQQQISTLKALSQGEVLEVYLNALAHVYDPHSDYLGHEQMESLSISMNLSLFGIGASLESVDGYCTIREVIPGSPAARSGQLRPGDRIVAVAQSGKEPTDVVNMPLTRTVSLIRGPKGTVVTLTITGANATESAPPRSVRLVRDKINLEDQEAKARILDLPRDNGAALRVGVIDIPEFYADISGQHKGDGRSVTTDVAVLVKKLKAERVPGIVLDLRRNGGGQLKEAISLTGLFIKKGPVVQTRGATGDVSVESDPDPSQLYDGPLVLLTSRYSASATEILAGALQDYGRAVVVGDSQTFGKGTVQSILPLAPIMDENGLAHAYDPGALKITISKFYRPGGASTQLRGVASDLTLPSLSDLSDVSESSLKNPLPWGSLPAAPYTAINRVKSFLTTLRERSTQRLTGNKDFTALQEDVERLKKNIAGKTISLNEAERREELAQDKARKSERQRALNALRAAQPVTYKITLKTAAAAGLPAPSPANDDAPVPAPSEDGTDNTVVAKLADALVLNESVQVLADYTELLHGSKLATSTTANTPKQ